MFSSKNLHLFGAVFLLTLGGLYVYQVKFRPQRQGFIEEVKQQAEPPRAASYRVNLNDAGVDEIASLPGIGPKRAEEIVKFRVQLGGFRNLDQLLNVPGIGPKTLENLRPYIRL